MIKKIFQSPTISTWLNFIIKFGGWLFLLPLILNYFDASMVSVWMVFQTINGILIIFDLGFNQSFSRSFSYCFGGVEDLQNDESGRLIKSSNKTNMINWSLMGSIFGTSKRIYFFIALICFVGILIISFWSVDPILYKLQQERATYSVILIVALGSSIKIYGNLFSSFLIGGSRVPLVNNWESIFGALNLLTSFLVFYMFHNVYLLLANQQFWFVASVVRNYILVKKEYPQLVSKPFDKSLFKIVFKSAWRSAVGIISGYGAVQLSSLLLTRQLSTSELASFLLAFKLVTLISDFSRAPFYSRLPELTTLHSRNSTKSFFRIATKGMNLSLIVFSLAILWVAFSGDFVLKLLNSDTEFVPTLVWSALGLAFFFERYGAINLQIYSVSNHILWHISNGITGILFIMILYISMGSLLLLAIPFSMILSNLLFYCPYNVWLNVKYYKINWWKLNSRGPLPIFFLFIVLLAISNLI